MLCQYSAVGTSRTGAPITGKVTIESDAIENGNVRYDIVKFQLQCGSDMYAGSTGNLEFLPAENPDYLVTVAGAFWRMGDWFNDGTGVGFKHVDDSPYDQPEPNFGYRRDYLHLAPRITVCGDLVQGGPFQPEGWLDLIWLK